MRYATTSVEPCREGSSLTSMGMKTGAPPDEGSVRHCIRRLRHPSAAPSLWNSWRRLGALTVPMGTDERRKMGYAGSC